MAQSVTLNSGSTLDYPAKFGKNKRTVALKGEAYFNVVHDAPNHLLFCQDCFCKRQLLYPM